MKVAFFSATEKEKEYIPNHLSGVDLVFIDEGATTDSIVGVTDAEVISSFVSSELSSEILEQFPNLKLIATRSTGYDHIDLAYAQKKGITVVNVPAYGARTVAEFTFALILSLSRKAYEAYDELRTTGERDVAEFEGFDLVGKTLGIIGTGNIGKNVIRIACGFDMKVCAFDAHEDKAFAKEQDVTYDSFENVLQCADIISLHLPLLETTRHIINKEAFRKMKDGVLLINTARGELIDTTALLEALASGKLAGAGLDVLEGERELVEEIDLLGTDVHDVQQMQTLLADHKLIDLPNVIVTPHIAFNTREAKQEILRVTVENIKQFSAGKAINVVS